MPKSQKIHAFIPAPDIKIEWTATCDDTYFVASDYRPIFNNDSNTLALRSGWGSRRAWGTPHTHSEVRWDDGMCKIISVRFGTKHNFGTQEYYLCNVGGSWKFQRGNAVIAREAQTELLVSDICKAGSLKMWSYIP